MDDVSRPVRHTFNAFCIALVGLLITDLSQPGSLRLSIDEDGIYYIFGLIKSPSDQNNSFFWKIDDVSSDIWRSIIEQESRLTLTRRDFRAFSAALEQAFSPNEALQEALDSARQTVRRA